MKLIDTYSPETHDGNSRCLMMVFIEQDYGKGKVANTKKQIIGMWRNKEWMLCATEWKACSAVMSLCNNAIKCDFSHDEEN